MARYYKGEKPCGGCGTSGKERMRNSAQSVCDKCKNLIQLGKDVREKSEGYTLVKLAPQHSLEDLYWKPFNEHRLLERHDAPRYIPDGFNAPIEGSSKEISTKLHKLFQVLDEGKKAKYDFTLSMHSFCYMTSCKSDIARAIFDLYGVLNKYAQRLYQEGYKDGNQLLVRLANGQASISDFNKKTIDG